MKRKQGKDGAIAASTLKTTDSQLLGNKPGRMGTGILRFSVRILKRSLATGVCRGACEPHSVWMVRDTEYSELDLSKLPSLPPSPK